MKEMSQVTFQHYQEFLIKEAGLYFRDSQLGNVQEKALERMKACKMKNYEQYFFFLQKEEAEEERKSFFEALTIGETYFFRNEPHFDVFRKHVLPEMIQKKTDKTLRIWTAGCSTGEEPYSIALTLKQCIPDIDDWQIDLLATDLNRQVIEKAKRGMYSNRSVGNVPEELYQQYFKRVGKEHAISDEIKKMVTFQRHNLVSSEFQFDAFPYFDIVFCRNVTIYFNMETLKGLIKRFSQCMPLGAYLFIGHAETLWNVSTDFAPVEFPHTFIYRRCPEGEVEELEPLLSIPMPSMMVPNEKLEMETEIPEEVEEHLEEATMNLSENQEVEVKTKEQSPCEEYIRAVKLANEEAYEEAVECLKNVVEEDNLHAPAYYLLGILYSKLEQQEEAIDVLRKLIYVNPDFSLGYLHLGHLYQRQGNEKLARKEYENGLRSSEGKDEAEEVELSEGMTYGVLRQAFYQGLEQVA